jgi:hypothetical protein
VRARTSVRTPPRFTNCKAVVAAPADWLPWNYEAALARLDQRQERAA